LAQAKGLELKIDNACSLHSFQADDDKLLRALVNLLSNAIKFTPAGGSITLARASWPRPGSA
jgi:signal transduction histidine kinase